MGAALRDRIQTSRESKGGESKTAKKHTRGRGARLSAGRELPEPSAEPTLSAVLPQLRPEEERVRRLRRGQSPRPRAHVRRVHTRICGGLQLG